jgi:hypothetical protein
LPLRNVKEKGVSDVWQESLGLVTGLVRGFLNGRTKAKRGPEALGWDSWMPHIEA